MNAVKSFRGVYKDLSNFYGGPVVYEGLTYQSSEAAFQAAKTIDVKERETFTNVTASQSKRMGHKILLRKDWECIKTDVMKTILIDKFKRNKASRELLIGTGNAHLEEGNDHGDRIWGTVNGVGENRLGIILMEIRDMIKNKVI